MRIIRTYSHALEREVSLASEISELPSQLTEFHFAKYIFQNKQSGRMIGTVRLR
jgi:hypothetical protein